MRLHSSKLTNADISAALQTAKDAGRVAGHVFFVINDERGSRSRARAWEIQLGTYDKIPGDKRGWKNLGTRGANSVRNGDGVYAATYDEWGYFIVELFQLDPDAVFGNYKGAKDFDFQTSYKYDAVNA